MNNILAGHTNSYHTYGLDEALEGIARAGFKYVELSAVRGWTEHVPLEAEDEQLAAIKAKLEHWGLQASALSGHSDLTTAEGVVDGKKAVDLCQKLGIGVMNTAVGGHASKTEDKAAFMHYIHDLSDYAAQREIVVSLEVHGEIMASGAKAVALIREIDRSNVLVNYDTANCMYYGGVNAADDIGPTVPYLAHVHLKDTRGGLGQWDFPAVGEGHNDWTRILGVLAAEGYRGPMSVEIEFQGLPWPPLEEVHRSMRVSFATLKALGLS